MNKIMQAALFARKWHGNQQRKGSDHPYIRHPGRVAARVSLLDKEFGDDLTATEEMVIAAWLHDTVEDTLVSLTDVAKEFGTPVADLVDGLTDRFSHRKHPELNRAERKAKERERLSQAPIEVRAIKLLDRIDNLLETDAESKFAHVYLNESVDLAELLKPGLPKLYGELRLECETLKQKILRIPTSPIGKAIMEIAEMDDSHRSVAIARNALKDVGVPYTVKA